MVRVMKEIKKYRNEQIMNYRTQWEKNLNSDNFLNHLWCKIFYIFGNSLRERSNLKTRVKNGFLRSFNKRKSGQSIFSEWNRCLVTKGLRSLIITRKGKG